MGSNLTESTFEKDLLCSFHFSPSCFLMRKFISVKFESLHEDIRYVKNIPFEQSDKSLYPLGSIKSKLWIRALPDTVSYIRFCTILFDSLPAIFEEEHGTVDISCFVTHLLASYHILLGLVEALAKPPPLTRLDALLACIQGFADGERGSTSVFPPPVISPVICLLE